MSRFEISKANVIKWITTLGCVSLLLSGASVANAAKSNSPVKVINVLPTELFYTGKANDLLWRDTCESWELSTKQIEEFFKLSREYQEGQEYVEYSKTFDWAHCSIIGTLEAENSEWNFEINASGAAEWRNENAVRTWGCADPKCKAFLIPEKNKPVIPPNPPVRILKISPAEYDKRYNLIESSQEVEESYCKSWGLTAEQAQEFFKLSDEYLEGRFQLFNWFPCNVTGVLESEGRQWQFFINQAATGVWRDGDTMRFWGCLDSECKSLNLVMPDGSLEEIDDK